MNEVNMMKHLDIHIEDMGEDYIKGSMPVDHRTQQPFGLLHGGATAVLAETLGSLAANLVVDQSERYCVGLQINVNHLRSVRSGRVWGTASPIHIGNSTQVWEIRIVDDEGNQTAVSRLTMAVLEKDSE